MNILKQKKNNDSNYDNNNDDNSEIYLNLYKPDGYGVIDDSIEAPHLYNVFDNLLDAVNYIVEHDLFPEITPLYLRNDLEFQKCIANIESAAEVEEEHVVYIRQISYGIKLSGNYYLAQFGDTSYYRVADGEEFGEK